MAHIWRLVCTWTVDAGLFSKHDNLTYLLYIKKEEFTNKLCNCKNVNCELRFRNCIAFPNFKDLMSDFNYKVNKFFRLKWKICPLFIFHIFSIICRFHLKANLVHNS